MASIKVKYRASSVENKDGVIYYQIIHNRQIRQLPTGYHLPSVAWDFHRCRVAVPPTSRPDDSCNTVVDHIREDMARLSRIIRRLEVSGRDYLADDVVEEYRRYTTDYSLFNYMKRVIELLKSNGKQRTAEAYTAALRSFMHYREGVDLRMSALSSSVMEGFAAWHKLRENSDNTISFYCRILRAVYNRAVEEEITDDRHPFRHVYTGVAKTVKRAIPIADVKKISKLKLAALPLLDFARDMFLMSFYLRGMSFIDMAYLRKQDLMEGQLVYRRRKTGQLLTVAWTREMQTIVDKYPPNPTQYLLPIIRRADVNPRNVYRKQGYNINKALKKVGAMAEVRIPLTMYVARHSWASAAHSKGVPLRVISEGMGHDSENTTRIYLASLETTEVDRANALILKALR